MNWSKWTFSNSLLGLLFIILLNPLSSHGNSLLETAWQEIAQAPKTSVQSLEPATTNFIREQRQSNIENATIYSLALLEMAALPDLEEDVKEHLTKASIAISPDYTFPETALCKLLFKQHHYLQSLSSLIRSALKFNNNPQEKFYASTFFWLAIAFIPLAIFLLVTLLMAIKYYRAFSEMGRIKLNQQGLLALLAITTVIALVVILIPAPLTGLLLLALGISLLATKRDSITLVLLLSSLLIVPLAYEKGMTSLLALDSSFFKTARHSAAGIYNESEENLPSQPANNQSELILQLFSQAETARLRGEYAKAEIFLEKIITDNIELSAVYNNLANLYLLQKKNDSTLTYYRKAIQLESASGIPYYNLSQAHIKLSFDLEKSSTALAQAFKLSPTLNQSLDSNQDLTRQSKSELIFMNLPDNIYRRFADSQPGKETFLPEFLRQILFPGATSGLYYTVIILALAGLLFSTKQTPANRHLCPGCGRLFHSNRKLKNKNCPSCRQEKLPDAFAFLGIEKNRPKAKPLALAQGVGGIILPGFYQFCTGNIFIAISLFLPLLLWCYNLIICQTGIMEPFPPSTAWLSLVFPILIWSINFALLAFTHYRQQTRSSSRSNP